MKRTKLIAVICTLTAALLLTLFALPAPAQAAASGTCGANLTWVLDDTGTLTISGTGDMENWSSGSSTPWYSNRSSIKKIVIGDSVTSIGNSAFVNCSNLASITIGDGVTRIGFEAFLNCHNLTSITIPDNVTSINDHPLGNCNRLTSIKVDANNPNYCSDNYGVLFDKNKTTLIQAPGGISGTYTIPDSVTSIGSEAFNSCDNLTSITIGDSVTSIGDYAFYYCSSLTSVTIGNSVATIDEYAFYNCDSLTSVTIPDSVKTIDEYAFNSCDSLVSVTIPDSIINIHSNTFNRCDNLKYNIYDNAKYLGNENNPYLALITTTTSCNIHPDVQIIAHSAFAFCNNLNYNIYDNAMYLGNANNPYLVLMSATNEKITSCNIHPETKVIYQLAFYGCYSLADVYITDPNAWCKISFDGYFSNLMYTGDHLHILDEDGKEVTELVLDNTVTAIPDYAFYNCTNLTSVTIPDSVVSIDYRAFYNCSSLTSVTIPDSVESIGRYAFSDCDSLTSVTIGDSVTSIGDYAFSYCSSLTSVTIGNNVETIGEYAFSGCNSLTSVTIPNSVTSIGEGAFYYCSRLTDVYITDPSAWCKISFGKYSANPMYYNTLHILDKDGNEVTELVLDNTVTAIPDWAFAGSAITTATIPDSVKSIGEFVFSDCNSLTGIWVDKNNPNYCSDSYGVLFDKNKTTLIQAPAKGISGSYTIPDSVTSIGYDAFRDCEALTSVTIGDSVTSIGYGAFEGCTALTSVTIGNSVETIGGYAFSSCKKLTSVTIGNSVETIGDDAFSYCSSLTDVYITDPSAWCKISFYDSSSNPMLYGDHLHILDKDSNEVTKLVLDNTVTAIPNYAFRGSAITTVTIPDGVTKIGNSAFEDCSSLTSVTIGNSVERIDDNAFYYCTSLAAVYITDVAAWCKISFDSCFSNPLYYAKNLYLNGKLITNLTIPEGVTGISDLAFSDCTGLTGVTIPDSVTSIGSNAFSGCTSLTSVTIGNSVTTIDRCAFSGCSSLTGVTIPDSVTSIGEYAFHNCTSLTNATIGNSVESIDWDAFSGCTSLTSVTIPASVESIGSNAFSNCTSLTGIWVDKNNPNYCSDSYGVWFDKNKTTLIQAPAKGILGSYTIPDSVTSIGEDAFSYCSSLTSVTIGDSVTSIGWGAFSDCSSLTSVTIPDSVTSIGDYAFWNCSSLTGVTIPDSVTSIGDFTFSDCTSLTSVTIGNNVESIGYSAFADCSSLTSVTIPDSVESIDRYVFANCHKLTDVYYCGTESQWNAISLNSDNYYLLKATIHFNSHAHNYTQTAKESPTCTKDGYIEYICSYGETYRETLPALGHTTENVIVPPTCTEPGYTTATCTVCGNVTTTPANATGHSNIYHSSKAPTCTEPGWEEYQTCAECDYTNYKEIPATGHSMTELPGTDPTCTESGITSGTVCQTCGIVETAQTTIPALGHSYIGQADNSSVCTGCGDIIPAPDTPAPAPEEPEQTSPSGPLLVIIDGEMNENTEKNDQKGQQETKNNPVVTFVLLFLGFAAILVYFLLRFLKNKKKPKPETTPKEQNSLAE